MRITQLFLFFLILITSCKSDNYIRSEVLYPWKKIDLGYSKSQVENLFTIESREDLPPDEYSTNIGDYSDIINYGYYRSTAYIGCDFRHGILWYFSYEIPYNEDVFEYLKNILYNNNMDKYIVNFDNSIKSYDFNSYKCIIIGRRKNDKYVYYYPNKEVIVVRTRYMYNSELQKFGLAEKRWLD